MGNGYDPSSQLPPCLQLQGITQGADAPFPVKAVPEEGAHSVAALPVLTTMPVVPTVEGCAGPIALLAVAAMATVP